MVTFKTIDTFIYYTGYAYKRSSKGEECHANQIIDSEDICKVAAGEFGLRYEYKDTYTDRPTGCYWSSSNAFYNDAKTVLTNAAYTGDRGGICLSQGIHFIPRLAQSCNQYVNLIVEIIFF